MHFLLAVLLALPAERTPGVVELHQHAVLLYEHIQNDDALSDYEKKEKRQELYESLSAAAEDESALTHELVGDPLVAGLVIEQFLGRDWDLDEAEAAGAARLARDSEAEEELRLDALRVLAVHHAASFEETAEAMARHHDHFAHEAAAILCEQKLVESKVRAIREECALRSKSADAIPAIADIAMDADEPAGVRFDAIYALAKFDDDRAHDALIILLSPQFWFDGPGPVRYTFTHSLTEVMSAMFAHPRRSDRAILENLRRALPMVPEEFRGSVEDHLATTLSALEALGM